VTVASVAVAVGVTLAAPVGSVVVEAGADAAGDEVMVVITSRVATEVTVKVVMAVIIRAATARVMANLVTAITAPVVTTIPDTGPVTITADMAHQQ